MSRYIYQPIFGVEPFLNVTNAPISSPLNASTFGGGAQLTGNNLLVSLWGNLTVNNNIPLAGQLLQPSYALDLSDPSLTDLFENGEKLYSPMFNSRTTFKLYLQNEDLQDPVTLPLCGFMNPPAELKNYYTDFANVVFDSGFLHGGKLYARRSLEDIFAWEAQFWQYTSGVLINVPGGYTPGGNLALTMAKSSGADGVMPTFYANPLASILANNPAEAAATLKSLAAGDFYVPVLFLPENDPGSDAWFIKFEWPHSIAR